MGSQIKSGSESWQQIPSPEVPHHLAFPTYFSTYEASFFFASECFNSSNAITGRLFILSADADKSTDQNENMQPKVNIEEEISAIKSAICDNWKRFTVRRYLRSNSD